MAKKKSAPAISGKTDAARLTAKAFVDRLKEIQSDVERKKIQRYFKRDEGQHVSGDIFIGVKMAELFALAKEFIGMSPTEIEKLLESPVHEVRAVLSAFYRDVRWRSVNTFAALQITT